MVKFQLLLAIALSLVILPAIEAQSFLHQIQKVLGLVEQPLTDDARVALQSRYTKVVDDESWKKELASLKAGERQGEMWFLWFTKGQETAGDLEYRLDTSYNDTMITISQAQASKKKYPITPNELVPLKPNFGRIDCSAAESSPLCHRFFMTPKIIPQLFVVVPNTTTTITEVDYVYENQTLRRPEAVYTTDVGLWRVPLNQNTTTADMIEFYNTKGWEKLTPWNGLLNPIDGKLAPVGEYIGILYRWYKFVPQWILMMGMSFFAKYLTSKFIPAASTTPRTKKEKKEKKEKREKKEKKEAAVPAAAPPPAIAINGKST